MALNSGLIERIFRERAIILKRSLSNLEKQTLVPKKMLSQAHDQAQEAVMEEPAIKVEDDKNRNNNSSTANSNRMSMSNPPKTGWQSRSDYPTLNGGSIFQRSIYATSIPVKSMDAGPTNANLWKSGEKSKDDQTG